MTNKNKKVIYNVVIIFGAVLLVAAASLLFFNMRGLDIDTAKALASIDELMPNISDSAIISELLYTLPLYLHGTVFTAFSSHTERTGTLYLCVLISSTAT